jgi:deoxycytidine triphosphate deaminase
MAERKKDPGLTTDLPNEICDYLGLIRDEELRAAIAKNLLLVSETTAPERVRQASYELRLGPEVEFLVLPDAGKGQAVAKYERPANGIGQKLKIEPGQTVKVFTMEVFNIPTNVVAHVIPVGNVYKVGLSPETTYADPGFDGPFYIILCNYSSRVVELEVGQPIARVEFVKLARSTPKPHPGSKHISEPPIWPRRVDRRRSQELLQLGIDNLLNELDQKDPPHIEHAFIAREVRRQVAEQFGGLSSKVASLERQAAWLRLIAYGLGVAACIWLIGVIWGYLPSNIQGKVAEETAKGVFGLLVLGVPLLFKSVRQTVGLALLGKPPEPPAAGPNATPRT